MPSYEVFLYDIESVTQYSGYSGLEALLGYTVGQDLFPYSVLGDSDSDNPGANATFGNLTGTQITVTDDDGFYENLDDGITVGTGRQTTQEFVDILNPTGASYLEYAYTLTDPATGDSFKIYSVINYNYPGPNSSAAGFVSEQSIDPTVQYDISSPTLLSVLSGDDGNPFIEYSKLVACFAKGSLIRTDKGDVPIEHLKIGSKVLTKDHGYQNIRWIGVRRVDETELAAEPKLIPIRIRAGALGEGRPSADLMVSPQHRMLVASKIADRMFGEIEVFVSAKSLIALDGVEDAKDVSGVDYYHLMCDRHQIIFANDAPTESLYLGSQSVKSMTSEVRDEIFAIFPELHPRRSAAPPMPARSLIPNRRGQRLVQRHVKNQKALLRAD